MKDMRVAQEVTKALAFRALGKVQDALQVLGEGKEQDRDAAAEVLRAELLLELGKRDEAEPVLLAVMEGYNRGEIAEDDSDGLGLVARAAQLMRSPEDANAAFNEAEQAGNVSVQTLLWRAEWHLENHDIAHTVEVLDEILKRAPNQPNALALAARVRIDEALDFDEAERLALHALKVNPQSTAARGVLGALRLRDGDTAGARVELAKGLEVNPKDLALLSLLGAAAFLEDKADELLQLERKVLAQNPEYSTFYSVVGLYAEWEHRYDDIVALMTRAVVVDPADGGAWAQLGLNRIRGGEDALGLEALRTAFKLDPYNVRTFNTLELFEKTIPAHYVDSAAGRFRIRYPTAERALLQRYVPELLNAAFTKMVKFYEFTPSVPIGVELYTERSSFAIRTSGLPDTAIQGVCFGKTLASLTPNQEHFNLGMTLWHELSHVFHIQLSRNHVPRWFTEGLAEYETLVERKEWQREQDNELYRALRDNRLPKIAAMNEAFTHAEEMADVAVAYYASTQIVRMLAEDFGRPKLRQMLVLWGEGVRTEEVIQRALGMTSVELDKRFLVRQEQRLARYAEQFVPNQRVGNPEQALRAARADQKDPNKLVRIALLAQDKGELAAASQAVNAALKRDPKHPDALWLQGKLALRMGEPEVAASSAAKLLALGKDGYETRLLVARAAEAQGDGAAVRAALEAAHGFDPSQQAAIEGLRVAAQQSRDIAAETRWLRALTELDEHDGGAYRDLMLLLHAQGETALAADLGPAAVNSDMESAETHLFYARALRAVGRLSDADYEFTSATLCPEDDETMARVEVEAADYWESRGNKRRAADLRERAAARGGP